jgi:hypothetical protein
MLLQKRTRKRLLQIFLFNLGIFFSLKLTDNIPTSWLAATVDRQSPSQQSLLSNSIESAKIAISPANNETFADGIYFYGQSTLPEQLGKEYLIFQVDRGKIKGAFFLPQSEYDCLQGTIDRQKINLSIEDIEGNIYTHQIAIEQNSSIASNGNLERRSVNLRGYQSISPIPATAKELLVSCLQ